MKNIIRTLVVTLVICLVSINTVTASDWSSYTSTYVLTSINASGQTVYTVCKNTNGNIKQEMIILARGGNVYNATTKTILTRECIGPNYVGIDSSMNVYVITRSNKAVKYSRNFRSNNTPSVLNYSGVYNFEKDYQNGFLTKIYTAEGMYDLKTGKMTTIVAGSTSSYPRVEKVDNNYYYYVNTLTYYTYRWNGENSSLTVDGKTIASNARQIAFSKYFILYVNNKNEVYRAPIGTNTSKMMTASFAKFNYDTSKWVLSVADSKYAYDVNTDSKDLYPKVKTSGNKFYYYTSDTKYYLYKLNNKGDLIYRGTKNSSEDKEVARDVYKVKFAEGYLVYVTEADKVYKVKIGTASSSYICSEFDRFIYDGDLVTAVENEDDKKYDIN